MRQQRGYIWKAGRSWFGRWREDTLLDGQVVRKQRCAKLADVCDRYRSKADVYPLLAEKLRPLNEGRHSPQSTIPVATFVERYYLPVAKENCRPSTYSAYKTQWATYLAPRLQKIILRDFRTVDAASLLADVYRCHGLSRSTLRHLKAFMSTVFVYAKNQGVLDGANPIRDAAIPKKASSPAETHAAGPNEVLAIMDALQKSGQLQARAAVALMFFAGLRPGEAKGACWEDYDGKLLHIRHSIWRTHVTEPKNAESNKPVPVIEPLRTVLAELRESQGNPNTGPILRGALGAPLNLDNLAKRILRPTLSKANLEWHGWYSLRRGIATLLNSIEKDAMAAKGLLRHASVITTQRHYIKHVPEITLRAMEKVEVLCSDGTNPADNRTN